VPAGVPPQDLLNGFLRVLADAGDALVCRASMLAVKTLETLGS
jgi:hypothetical protein